MGNYPACLSTEHFHYISCTGKHPRDHEHGDAALFSVADDLSCSTLPLLISDSASFHSSPQQYAARPAQAIAASPTQLPGKSKHLKPATKKVRFAEEVMLIASTTPHPNNMHAEQYLASLMSSPATKEAAESEELLHKTKHSEPFLARSSSGGHGADERSSDTCMDQSSRGDHDANERSSSTCIDQISSGEITQSSSNTKTIRLKVVISKKELSQLLSSPSSSTSSSPAMELGANSDALMGRILSPLLSSHRNSFNKSQILIDSCQQYGVPCTWRHPL